MPVCVMFRPVSARIPVRKQGYYARGADADQRSDDVGRCKKPDDRVGDVEIVLRHRGPDLDVSGSQQRYRANEDCHRPGTRNPDEKRRNKPAAFLRNVRAFGTDHATHLAAPEPGLVLRGLDGVAVRDPVDDRAAESGNDSDYDADDRTANAEPGICKPVADAAHPAAAEHRTIRNGSITTQQGDDLRDRENPETDDHEFQPVDQTGQLVAGHSELAGRVSLLRQSCRPSCRDRRQRSPSGPRARRECPSWKGRRP